MNNNLKRVLFVLFVVSALLLMIGTANADAVELNDNLEASLDLDDGLSIDDDLNSNPDNKASDQLTISNIDGETDTTQSVDEDLNDLNSNDVVSNNEDATINTKDSDKNIKAANNLGADGSFSVNVKALNDSVKVGEIASFEIVGSYSGNGYYGSIPVLVEYDENELHYVDYQIGINHEIPSWYPYNMSEHFTEPETSKGYWDQVTFSYNAYDGFYDSWYFNITLNYVAKKAGNPGNYVTIKALNQPAVADRTNVIDAPPEFILEDKVLTPTARVGDTVAFEIFGRNIGGAFTEQYVPIYIQYDESELHCIGYDVGVNPDVPEMDFSDNYQVNRGYDGTYDSIQVLYDCGGNFANGHCFNFTLYFKVINDENEEPGCHAYMFWDNGDGFAEAINTTKIYSNPDLELLLAQDQVSIGEVISLGNDKKVNFTKTALEEFVKPGDAVDFVVYLENIGDGAIQYQNGILTLYDYYPTDGFEYLDSFEISSDSTYASYINIQKRFDGHVQIVQYLPDGKFHPGDVLNVTLHFKALKNGILCNHMFLNDYNEKNHITGSVVSGEPGLNLTKTCNETVVDLNDDVYFNIFVENTGDFRYYDHTTGKYKLIIQDFYPEGLEFVELVDDWYISQEDGNITVQEVSKGVLNITYTFDKDSTFYDNAKFFEPGSYINLTLKFKAVDYGKWTNDANVYWKYKDWGEEKDINISSNASVIVGKPEFTIEKVASDKEVNVGDIVTFKITYTNTGKVDLTGVYITDKDYSEGLVYSDYSDKSLWTFDGKDTWYYNDVLPVGESVVLELSFEVTTPGEKTNTAVGGHNITNETSESNDTVLVKENEANPLGTPNEDDEEETPDDSEEPSDDSEETPDEPVDTAGAGNEISVDKASPAKKVANIPATGNPLFVLLISLLTLCFVPLRGKK